MSGHGGFSHLDDEARAQHESWDDIARVVFLSAVLAAIVWCGCSTLRYLVRTACDATLDLVEHGRWLGAGALVAALVVGGVARGALVRRKGWADAAGDGMDVALENYHITYRYDGDDPQPRYDRPAFSLGLKKAVMTLLTLGTGGSGGLEAPVVVLGESTAAGFSRVLRVRSEYELRTYQLAAIAAAVATLLGAPFTAALFAIEVAYGDRIIYRKFAYALFAALIAYVLNTRLNGFAPLFPAPQHAQMYKPTEYAATALVAIAVSAPVALGFGQVMTRTRALVSRKHPVLTGAWTGAAAGVVAVALFWSAKLPPRHVLGVSEETIAGILEHDPALAAPWILALAVIGKMLTTGLTVGGGGSAGLLVPSMYFGGVSGALTATVLARLGLFPGLDPGLFAVVGIASALVAVVGVPLAAIALVLEVFGTHYGPPAILACGVTYLLTLRMRLYKNQRMSPNPVQDETG